MKSYKKWINELEEKGFEDHAHIKTVQEFDWGLKYLNLPENDQDPYKSLLNYNKHWIEHSNLFFSPLKLKTDEYKLENEVLSFPSSIQTPVENNNIVKMQYYPVKDKHSIIIVVPHWNAPPESYDKICLQLQKIKFPCLRMTLPYHDTRGNGEKESSTLMVSPNIGRTIQAMQQSVRDILSSIDWLENQGYRNIGIMGASIGSCCGFIAACHDPRVNGFFANLMSSYFGDVVVTGISTKHIKDSFDKHNLEVAEELKITDPMVHEALMLNSPIAFVDKIRLYNPKLKQFIMSGKYDTTFLFRLTKLILDDYKLKGINFKSIVLPCGHYSLGKYWFKYIDAWYIYRFFSSIFKQA